MPRNPEMDERFTPAVVFKPLDFLFHFTLDPCTTPDNPLACEVFYTKDEDGLARPWTGRVFINPPYSAMRKWASKAVEETQKNGCFVAFLLPNDCSTGAWQLLERHSWGRWEIPFRVKFLDPNGRPKDVARSHVVFFLGGLAR